MRIPSGVTDQFIYFVAVDATDFTTRETGLSSFTVYRSRNGGAATAMTTPTINETSAANMPGVYELLLDEDMTIDAGDDTQEMCFHITHTGMAPVSRVIELYRPKITIGDTLTTSSGVAESNVKQVSDDATAADNLETACDNYSATRGLAGTALPAAAADAAGGLPISDAGGLDLDARLDAAVSSRLAPTTAGRTLDVTAGGTAGIDWGNVENPTTAVDLSATDIQLCDTTTTVTNQVTSNVTAINSVSAAAVRLSLSANQIIPGTVDTAGFTSTTTEFEADDITEATADHYNGRIIVFTTGALAGQATSISDYSLVGGRGHFTVVAMTEAPANNDTFIIL